MIKELLAIPNMAGYPKTIPEGFNWIAVLKDLSAGAPCSIEMHEKLCRMAGNWVTCACGQLCASLPRTAMGRPYDSKLVGLGTTFFHHIDEKKWCKALSMIYKIEARTSELLKQLESSNTQCAS